MLLGLQLAARSPVQRVTRVMRAFHVPHPQARKHSHSRPELTSSSLTLTSPPRSPPTSTPTPLPAPNPNRITTDCPTSNVSTFAPQEPRNGNPGLQNFLKYCNSSTDGENLISAMVIDFNSCIALCSNWNSWQPDGKKCASATFLVDGRVPANCWAKTGKMVSSVPGSEGAALLL